MLTCYSRAKAGLSGEREEGERGLCVYLRNRLFELRSCGELRLVEGSRRRGGRRDEMMSLLCSSRCPLRVVATLIPKKRIPSQCLSL